MTTLPRGGEVVFLTAEEVRAILFTTQQATLETLHEIASTLEQRAANERKQLLLLEERALLPRNLPDGSFLLPNGVLVSIESGSAGKTASIRRENEHSIDVESQVASLKAVQQALLDTLEIRPNGARQTRRAQIEESALLIAAMEPEERAIVLASVASSQQQEQISVTQPESGTTQITSSIRGGNNPELLQIEVNERFALTFPESSVEHPVVIAALPARVDAIASALTQGIELLAKREQEQKREQQANAERARQAQLATERQLEEAQARELQESLARQNAERKAKEAQETVRKNVEAAAKPFIGQPITLQIQSRKRPDATYSLIVNPSTSDSPNPIALAINADRFRIHGDGRVETLAEETYVPATAEQSEIAIEALQEFEERRAEIRSTWGKRLKGIGPLEMIKAGRVQEGSVAVELGAAKATTPFCELNFVGQKANIGYINGLTGDIYLPGLNMTEATYGKISAAVRKILEKALESDEIAVLEQFKALRMVRISGLPEQVIGRAGLERAFSCSMKPRNAEKDTLWDVNAVSDELSLSAVLNEHGALLVETFPPELRSPQNLRDFHSSLLRAYAEYARRGLRLAGYSPQQIDQIMTGRGAADELIAITVTPDQLENQSHILGAEVVTQNGGNRELPLSILQLHPDQALLDIFLHNALTRVDITGLGKPSERILEIDTAYRLGIASTSQSWTARFPDYRAFLGFLAATAQSTGNQQDYGTLVLRALTGIRDGQEDSISGRLRSIQQTTKAYLEKAIDEVQDEDYSGLLLKLLLNLEQPGTQLFSASEIESAVRFMFGRREVLREKVSKGDAQSLGQYFQMITGVEDTITKTEE